MAVPAHDERDFEFAKKFGLKIKQVITGLNDKLPYTGSGKLMNSYEFNDQFSSQVKKKITKYVKGKWVTKYKLRDWVFSRQRYWGEPIPVMRDDGKIIPLKERDLPLKLPKVKSYEPTGTAESPLANIPKWINVKVGKKIYKRESNTMPQWAGSSWYYLRYMDPNNNKALVDKKKEKYWNEVDLYVGGAEHATRHLIYARFWHKFLYDIGVVANKEPFRKLQNVGLIIASDGRKMSKRFGNVINPDSIIKNFGADALRMYEMFMGPFDQSAAWGDDNIVGVRRFLDRVWRLSSKVSKATISNKNFEILLHKTIKKVSEDIESMSFNTAVSSMMILLNEMEKMESVNKGDFENFLKILNPFAPHITEEIWHNLGNKKLLVLESWPKADLKKMVEPEVKIIVQIDSKVRAECMVKKDASEEEVLSIVRGLTEVEKWVMSKNIARVIYVKNRLINLVLS
jgi:leucyl-tRNA synthetase